MPDWLIRYHRSRRARNLTLGALGILTLGSCGGAVLATFTVEGSNMAQYRGSTSWESRASTRSQPPEWMQQASAEFGDAGFSGGGMEGYSDASY